MISLRRAVNNADLKRFRFWLQLALFALLVYGGYLAIDLGNHLPMFACGFNQEGRAGVCYLLPLQHQLSRSWPQLFSMASMSVLTGFGIFYLWFIVLNKSWCGYICPLGTIQDWITALRRRLGVRYSRYTQGQFHALSRIKYLLLALMILIPLGIGGGWFSRDMATPFCLICPGRMILPMFTGDFSQFTLDFSSKTALVMTALGMGITGLFLAGSFVKKRFFCFFCPMSALHYLISKPALLKLKKDGDKCTRCGDCYTVCDMDIREIADDIKTKDIMMDDCILCLKCVAACPEPGALKANFASVTFFESTEEGFLKRTQKGWNAKRHEH
ncbi:4Fe-4S binding protein [Sulfuricella sp.]|uniref:4Fe-4S binding protein n=1 Tax=Sulfuricella sp. TaxID=2099377 RepID=UPI002B6D361B|nr:4Fe-4S binding protein [Sulfuricella sp.]HUX62580.1 4Fe-4S binding protein [Sulfuricella sp.]